MRTRRISTATALAVLFSSVVLVGGAANPAVADSSRILPAASLGDIVADGVHQRVFVSDPESGQILATDYSGKVVRTLGELPGVNGLELSADSSTLYAGVATADSIVAIDTATLTESARYDTGRGTRPTHPALAGGKLWFGYGNAGDGNIGSLDLSGAEPVVTLDQDPDRTWYAAPLLASTPGAPGTLAAGIQGQSPAQLAVYDVSSGTAARTAQLRADASNLRDIALSPDGGQVVVASGAPYFHQVYRTSDLRAEQGYTSDAYPNAVEIAPDGTVAAGIDGWYDPDVYIYPQGGSKTASVREYDFPNTGSSSGSDVLDPAGLAWAPDTSRLFAVTTNSAGVRSFRVLTDTKKSVTSIVANAPEKATRAKKLTVSGKVTSKTAFPAGSKVAVVRTDLESPKGKSLGTAALKSNGSFSFTDTPPSGGKVTYRAVYAGDATHSASSGSDAVAVSRATASLKLNRNKDVYSYGKDVSFTAQLGKTYKNRVVELWVDPFGSDKPKKLVRKAKVNSQGNLSVTVDMKRDTAVTAVFAGDSRTASKSVKSTAYARVKVSTSLSKHYRTAKIGKTTYAYYSKKKNPVFTTTMSYYQGRTQRLSLQLYYQGTWYDAGQEYFALGTSGRSAITLQGPHETGYKMRMRSSYVNGASGDSVNSTTHGAWKYFIFTK
ncbi:Ig-like domain repeat protein [Streptomyces sp. ADI96-02]|uniref:Ig-like domain repeat protein n=1 Tax=Streptomyces sp. ADI96-02 TaxID=1522760 RepID=UPI000F54FA11|nr:Ig-like domain repeat protein [Streptomyces sp. ADI96-02]